MSGLGPSIRPRRLRQSAAMRRLVGETDLRPRHLVLPLFVREGLEAPQPIGSTEGRNTMGAASSGDTSGTANTLRSRTTQR